MAAIQIGRRRISAAGNGVYIIAEIGQNHQGSVNIAKQLIVEARMAGCHCVKLQKSFLPAKFTHNALARHYPSRHSFGESYGAHKAYLEFSIHQYRELQRFCDEMNIDFAASAMDKVSLKQLAELCPPFIKIGSGDANNFPLLEEAAAMTFPLIISTGMQTMYTVRRIVHIMECARKTNYALMHCVSSYPTHPADCTLQMIPYFKQEFPNVVIGYSGHELGVEITKAAVLMGARIVERHITMSRYQKGSDHICSLEPPDLRRLVEGIEAMKRIGLLHQAEPIGRDEIIRMLNGDRRALQMALADIDQKSVLPCELKCRQKLGKSVVCNRNLPPGIRLKLSDIEIKVSEPSGIAAEDIDLAIGAVLTRGIYEDTALRYNHVISFDETWV